MSAPTKSSAESTGELDTMPTLRPAYRIPGVVYQRELALDRYVEAGVLTQETLEAAFRATAARFPRRPALVEDGWSCTYAELDALTDRAGAAFLGLGLRPLDRVVFQAVNSRELVIALFGCLKAGLVPVCTLAAHRRLEIGYIGHHAGAVAHFVQGDDPKFDFPAFAQEIRAEIPSMRHTVILRGPGRPGAPALWDLIDGQEPGAARDLLDTVTIDPFQVAVFQLSGGTTGVPKIIPRFQNEYLFSVRSIIAFHGFDETLVAFTPNPMIHNAPFLCVWGPALFCGGAVAICGSMDPAVLGPFLLAARPDWQLLPASVVLRLKESGWLDRLDTRAMRGFSAGSGAAKLRSLLGDAPAWPLFGMTEGLLCYCNASDPPEARDGTVGRPVSEHDEVKLLELGSEQPVPDGEVGELVVRGPCTIRGYYDAPERNLSAFTSDGFYRSGDLMRARTIEGRRYLVFEGRAKDVIDRGGEKINCEEVERACAAHPAVAAVAVVAMPDPIYGQRACAFIVPAAGMDAPTVRQLGAFLETAGLAKFKWPERVEAMDEFPLTSSGKLSKPRLREIVADRLRQADPVSAVA